MKLDKSTYRPFGLEAIEMASRDEIASVQTKRLRRTLENVYENVPLYRKKFDATGVSPSDFRHLDDLKYFPFTTKQDLRESYPFGMFAVPRERVLRIHASSGTTGKPTVVGYTRGDIDTWADLVARSLRACGVRPGMLVHISVGYGLFTGGMGMHYGAERLGCTVVPVAGGMTPRQVQLILDFQPDVIVPTPSYLLVILDEFRAQGLDPSRTSLKIAFCGAEPWTNSMRAEIESAFNIDAIDAYGLSEVIGPGVACECIETKNGPYIWEDHFYPEIVHPHSDEVLCEGEAGEIVFTTLTKEAMPVIRYRTRDLTRLLPGEVRSMRRMEKVIGRSDDMLIIRGVNVFPTQIEEQILRCDGLGPHFVIELRREGRLDSMRVLAEARPSHADEDARKAQSKLLTSYIRNVIGLFVEVAVAEPGQIERSTGKAKRVIDLRSNLQKAST
jgi:phenylacetate-CoA ligase